MIQPQTEELMPDAPLAVECGRGVVSLRDVLARPLPYLRGDWLTRWLTRGLLVAFRGRFLEVRGLERIAPEHDPFILALNHSQKLEALFVPALLAHSRQGKLIHFLADWNLKLVPGVAVFYRCGQVITIDRKPARPRFLNVLKPWLTDDVPGFTRARQRLEAGASVGIFPEGTTNRDSRRLLKGHAGAARLSLETGVPVVPAGIRFPRHRDRGRIPELAPMVLEIGAPLVPVKSAGEPDLASVRDWHGEIMRQIAQLSHKEWQTTGRQPSTPK